MVQARKKKKKLMGSHQRCWLWGRHAVGEILEVGRWPMKVLYLDEALPEDRVRYARERAAALHIPVECVSSERITQLCHTKEHQGYLAKMSPFPYASLHDVLDAAVGIAPSYVVLDGVQDPYNFGAIIRSAEVLGMQAVFVGESHQAEVNRLVARASAGAVNRLPIVQVPDILELIPKFRERNIRLLSASEKANVACHEYDLTQPVAIVMGNEGDGVRPEIQQHCDQLIAIPQVGAIGSLNVAAAAAILFYETSRQRG